MHEREIFEQASELLDPVEREAFLDQVCGADQALRTRIEALLASHEHASGFLNVPVLEQIRPAVTSGNPTTIESHNGDPLADDLTSESDDSQPLDLSFLKPSAKSDSLGTLGHYEVLRVLGHGAFGIVLLAFDEKLHRQVAIKVMNPQLAATSPPRKRFLREARSAAAIKHENIVQVYSVEEEPLPYLVMEYIEGQTLQEKLDTCGPLDVPEVLHLGRQMALGLAAAHAQGLIHRDIKPGNILLEQGAEQRVKITDFGLARAADDASMTQTGFIAGTPMYMAPEQARGETLDQRADLFSMGSVLYQMTSGRAPFRASTTMGVLKRVAEETPRPIRDIIPEVPAWPCAIIAKLHAKSPEDRFQSAQEVVALLEKCQQALIKGVVPELTGLSVSEPTNTDSEPQHATVTTTARQKERTSPWGWRAVAAAVLGLAVVIGVGEATGVTRLATTMIRLTRGEGTLVIEADDPGLSIAVEGEQLTIAGAGVKELKLVPGSYTVVATKDGAPVKHELVQITRGGRQVLKVTLEPGKGVESETTPAATVPKPASPSNQSSLVAVNLTPPEPLGTWEMGPEPSWFQRRPLQIKNGDPLPGIVDRPAILPGIKRWNVETVWPKANLTAAQFSPDGQWLAIGSVDGKVRIYEAATMTLATVLPGHGNEHGAWDFSWHPDSERLAVAADNYGTLRLWTRHGELLFEEAGLFHSVCWNRRGDLLADGNSGGLRLRQPDSKVAKVLSDGLGVSSPGLLQWSPGDTTLACWHNDGKLRRWNVESGATEVLLENLPAQFITLAWSSTGWLAVPDGKQLKLFDPDGHLSQSLDYKAGPVAWHPNGQQVYLAEPLRAYDIEKKAFVATIKEVQYGVRFLACCPDGTRLFSGVGYGHSRLRTYSPDLEQQLFASAETTTSLRHLAWSHDGLKLASIDADDDRIRLWTADGQAAGEVAAAKNLQLAAWSPDDRELIAAGNEGVWLGNTSSGLRRVLQFAVPSLAWSPDGTRVALGTLTGRVVVIDRAGNVREDLEAGTGLTHVAWSPATNRLVAHCEQKLLLCDPSEGWTLKPWGETAAAPRRDFPPVWSPDGNLLSVDRDGWYDRAGQRITKPEREFASNWRPDGKQYLAWFNIYKFQASGLAVARQYKEDFHAVNHPVYHPRGHLLVTGHNTAEIVAWREADLQPHWHAVLLPEGKSATFSAAGELLDGKEDAVEKYLVYYVEREDGRIEMLKPSEFQKLLPSIP
jgi:serine/threonine protein kinase/WD40 repeat protein